MKKNVYLVQVNVAYSDYLAYIPYAAGCLAAYALQDDEIMREYEIRDIIYLRKTIEETLDEIEAPFVVGFSCYIWNMEYNKTLAKRIKEKYPDCHIVFGGHNVPYDATLLEKEPCIDFLIHGEGEVCFANLLKALVNGTLSDLKDISLRDGDRCVTLPRGEQLVSLDTLPSPYTTGVFDKMLADRPLIHFQGTLETNRGCPYGCAFCDWCFTEKIRFFPMEKIRAEIRWMAEHKIDYCYCADANFGIVERDMEVAEYVVQCNKETGFPKIFKPCYAKNSDDRVFAIGSLLNSNGVDKGVTLAYQSMTPQVLENIGRKNLDLAYFTKLNARYAEAGIPTYTELILGLPGETYDSFCGGLCSLLEAGQHNSITVYTCQVYCNAPIAQKAYREKYGIQIETAPLHGIHYPANFNGVQEYYDIIVETKDMSKAEWVKANMFSVCLQSFHHLGLLRCFAIYARYECGISYFEFYNRLLAYVFADESTHLYELFEMIREKTDCIKTSDWCYQKDVFSKVGWYFEEGVFLDLVYHFDAFQAEIRAFIDSLGIEKKICDALFDYQMRILRMPGQEKVVIESDYDFYRYFENIYDEKYQPLEKRKNRLTVYPDKRVDRWDVYARDIIWYGKRRSATLLSNPMERSDFEYLD